MSSPLKFSVAILACVFIGSCRNNLNTPMEQADIISDLSTTNIDDKDLSKPAIITGHIKNRHLYPDEKEVRITIPFYGRVPYTTLISPIWIRTSSCVRIIAPSLKSLSGKRNPARNWRSSAARK